MISGMELMEVVGYRLGTRQCHSIKNVSLFIRWQTFTYMQIPCLVIFYQLSYYAEVPYVRHPD